MPYRIRVLNIRRLRGSLAELGRRDAAPLQQVGTDDEVKQDTTETVSKAKIILPSYPDPVRLIIRPYRIGFGRCIDDVINAIVVLLANPIQSLIAHPVAVSDPPGVSNEIPQMKRHSLIYDLFRSGGSNNK